MLESNFNCSDLKGPTISVIRSFASDHTESLVLGLIAGIALLIAGETTIEVDLTFEFGPYDGIWWILGVPLVSILNLMILSPLSFLVHGLMRKRHNEGAQEDTQ
jgi:hypothetical protein